MCSVRSLIKGGFVVVFHSDARPVRIISCDGTKGLEEGLFIDERERAANFLRVLRWDEMSVGWTEAKW